MAIALRAVSTAGDAGAGGVTEVIDKPAGTQDGDLQLLHIVKYADATIAFVLPLGWTQLYEQTDGLYARHGVFWKVANGEPANYTITCGTTRALGLFAFSGVNQGAPINASASSTSPNYQVPDITTTVDDCMLVGLVGAGVVTRTYTWPVGWTEDYDLAYGASGLAFATATGAHKLLGAAGATGTTDVTPSSTSFTYDYNYAVALTPAGLNARCRVVWVG